MPWNPDSRLMQHVLSEGLSLGAFSFHRPTQKLFQQKVGNKGRLSFTKASLMAWCLLGTLIHAAPGIIFNYLWNGVVCDNSDKEIVCFRVQHINLCHVHVNLFLLSATQVLTGGFWRTGGMLAFFVGGGSASHLLLVENHHQGLRPESSTVCASSQL